MDLFAWMLVGTAWALPLDAVVLIETGTSVCAGAFVDAEGRVVTAYHCVASGGRSRVESRDGRSVRGRVVAVDVRADLALLSVEEFAGSPWLELRADPIAVGAPVHALGHPFGAVAPYGFFEGTLRWSATTGVVSNVGVRALQFTAPVGPGNSGGPVVDDEGRLCAIVSRRLTGDGMGFGAPASAVARLMDEGRRRGPFGGTVALGVVGSGWSGLSLAVGPELELAVRDRVVGDVRFALPVSPVRWHATRLGSVSWSAAEARLALRQRLFSGRFTLRVDAYGGASWVSSAVSEGDFVATTGAPTWMVGGQLGTRSLSLDVAWTPLGIRGAIALRWPGVVNVF